MARYAGGGKITVESCRSIDVLEWHRRGYLRSPRWFSWTVAQLFWMTILGNTDERSSDCRAMRAATLRAMSR